MSTDEELLAQMSVQEESPDDPTRRRVPKQSFAKSRFTVAELKEKVGDTVMVKCISELGPWADDKQLKYWEDYSVSVEDAVMLDERRFAVILMSYKDLQESATTTQPVIPPQGNQQNSGNRPQPTLNQNKHNRR